MPIRKNLWKSKQARTEATANLLVQIKQHGPGIASNNRDLLAALYYVDRPEFTRIRHALVEAGSSHEAVMYFAGVVLHPVDCACWRCISRLQVQILRHHARMQAKIDMEQAKALHVGAGRGGTADPQL